MTGTTLPDAADARHLTEVLRTAGVLASGSVREVFLEGNQLTVLSQIIRLRLTYDGAGDEAPSTLILKTCHPDRVETFWFAGRAEAAFYRDVAPQMAHGTVPRCYEASYDEATKLWHLVLEDLSATHMIATAWSFPPTTSQCEQIVTALARAHAAWWDHGRLGNPVGEWPDTAAGGSLLRRFANAFGKFRDKVGDRLTQDRCDLYLKLLDQAPRLLKRLDQRRHATIAHGDAHFWNFLLPREGVSADARVFDWDSWYIGVGSDDLAYMIAMHWYPERRARLEGALLDRYHEALMASGVSGYSREALDGDYRLSVLFHSMSPAQQASNNIPPVIWWNNFERIMMAVDDLDCRALLG